jgi:hypothetical protein
MKNNFVVLVLILLIALAFYFLGKKNGAGQTRTDIVQNVALVKEIAQLASLEVTGETRIKVSNRAADNTFWNNFKNYFTENTLQVTLPYEAKYGVDMTNRKMDIDTKAGVATIYLPAPKLISMQLRLDRLESMSQAGILSSVSISDFVKAQKQMYNSARETLEANAGYLKLSEDNIRNTLAKYYEPLGYKVNIIFDDATLQRRLDL